MNNTCDLAIIRGGGMGLLAAPFAARLRASFHRKDRIGRDSASTGCVPSKTLIKTARGADQTNTEQAMRRLIYKTNKI